MATCSASTETVSERPSKMEAQKQLELDFAATPALWAFPFEHDGRWHAVYRMTVAGGLASIGDSLLKSGAQQMADDWNRDHASGRPA